jgi:hypothetical protein
VDVDLLFLSRDTSPPREDVRRGVETQEGVRLLVHRVIGTPRPDDPNRWETIARARNEGKRLGSAPWVMYLDDDVVLGPGCVARLVEGLSHRPGFAALAADCAGEMDGGWQNWDYPRHVGMASTLFRRERLADLTFRWEPEKCECRCCCDDLRLCGFAIGYMPGALAWHRPVARGPEPVSQAADIGTQRTLSAVPGAGAAGRILAAFNRRDAQRFRRMFLTSLRASGNPEQVTAVAYGLYPSERGALAAVPGVEVVALPDDGSAPAVSRISDFQHVIARWPDDTPVAFWDAGDVIFQAPLGPLWETVRERPDVILAAPEPRGHPENPVVWWWTSTISDPEARRRAFELLSTRPFLNGGFAAGTVRSLSAYLREAERLLNSPALEGVSPPGEGDQVALNLYCHTNPHAWREVSQGWNYTLAGRDPRRYGLGHDGRVVSLDGTPVHVVHGNARTLGSIPWEFLTAEPNLAAGAWGPTDR